MLISPENLPLGLLTQGHIGDNFLTASLCNLYNDVLLKKHHSDLTISTWGFSCLAASWCSSNTFSFFPGLVFTAQYPVLCKVSQFIPYSSQCIFCLIRAIWIKRRTLKCLSFCVSASAFLHRPNRLVLKGKLCDFRFCSREVRWLFYFKGSSKPNLSRGAIYEEWASKTAQNSYCIVNTHQSLFFTDKCTWHTESSEFSARSKTQLLLRASQPVFSSFLWCFHSLSCVI